MMLLVTAALSACFPLPYTTTFYKPSAPVGETITYGCSMGPPNALNLIRKGVRFVFWMPYDYDPKYNGIFGKFQVFVPRGKTVHWDVRRVQALLQSGQPIGWGYYPHTLVVTDWNVKGEPNRKVNPPTMLSGDRFTSTKQSTAWYAGTLGLKAHLPNTFYLIIPKMKINGASYPSFTIRFDKAHGLFWGPINGC